MLVREAEKNEWEEAMALAWRVFKKFNAPEYTEEGVETFLDFISDEGLHQMFLAGEYKLFVAESGGKIVGMISLRMNKHISLLFVDEKFHHIGVAKKLVDYLINYMINDVDRCRLTVNASPYAVGFYHKMGFKDTDLETIKEGIRFTPMMKMVQ